MWRGSGGAEGRGGVLGREVRAMPSVFRDDPPGIKADWSAAGRGILTLKGLQYEVA